MISFNISENIKVALRSIRGQMLRTVITILIIATGITALVGILTAVDSIKTAINEEFMMMGANTFSIRNRAAVRVGRKGRKPKNYPPIRWRETQAFVRQYTFPSDVSVSTIASFQSTVRYKDKKSNPNITVAGGDALYLRTAGYKLQNGRNFTQMEIQNNAHVSLIGYELWQQMFENKNAVGARISIGNSKYTVIGVLQKKGNSMGFGGDRLCILPIGNVRQYFSSPDMNFVISVLLAQPQQLDPAINEATGMMRMVRKVPIGKENTFEISRSDSLSSMLIENLSNVSLAAVIIGLITLLSAAISLMNIMLVSVSERTREIGVRKAIGAPARSIMIQFLTEAVVICVLGGILGVVLGIGAGNVVSFMLGVGFIIPWQWMIFGIIMCVGVGIVAGIYPAGKAAGLNPIMALHYE